MPSATYGNKHKIQIPDVLNCGYFFRLILTDSSDAILPIYVSTDKFLFNINFILHNSPEGLYFHFKAFIC